MTVLYVGGKKRDIPQLSGTGTLVDYVQNGMIALSAAQTQSFDAIIIEDQLPLMTASRLIDEFVSIKQEIPLISIIRGDERRSQLMKDFGHGLFGWFEPDYTSTEELMEMLTSADRFHNFIKDTPKISLRSFTPI